MKWLVRFTVPALTLGISAAQTKKAAKTGRGNQARDHQAVHRQLKGNLPLSLQRGPRWPNVRTPQRIPQFANRLPQIPERIDKTLSRLLR
jgi:hypothetical protein